MMPVPLHPEEVRAIMALEDVVGGRPQHQTIRLEDGSVIGFMEFGDGPTKLVVLHGFRGSPYIMSDSFEEMARIGALTIVALSLPCHGPSAITSDFDRAADLLADAARELGLVGLTWIGHSMGAMLACAVTYRHPGLVKRLFTSNMPIIHPKQNWGYYTGLGKVVLDVLCTSTWALLSAPSRQERLKLISRMYWTIHEPFDAKSAIGMLKSSPHNMRAILAELDTRGVPQMHVLGWLDPVARPQLGKNKLPGQRNRVWSHDALFLPGVVGDVCALLEELFSITALPEPSQSAAAS
jgi:pimeloyl-ACP methyl ester carboxylesterase